MELLFKREQTTGRLSHINFKLWSKLEISEDEQALIERYSFDEAALIVADEDELRRQAIKLGGIVFVIATILLIYLTSRGMPAIAGGGMIGACVGYLYLNEKRETIFVKDLLHGRNFTCESVVDLAKKEAWLEGACSVFRQVMESAKHWDGTETHTIDPLPKEQARELILRAF